MPIVQSRIVSARFLTFIAKDLFIAFLNSKGVAITMANVLAKIRMHLHAYVLSTFGREIVETTLIVRFISGYFRNGNSLTFERLH